MPIVPFGDKHPRVDPSAFIAANAMLVGDVQVGPRASVWFNAVLRGDSGRIEVGARTNIQDGAILHTDPGRPCVVEDDCTVGHGAIVHGCRVRRGSLVGMGSVILTGAEIGEESLVAAGALVPEGRRYGPRSLLVGSPVRRLRDLSEGDLERLHRGVSNYLGYVEIFRAAGPGG